MKTIIQLSLVLLLGTTSVKAQTWDEIFRQKKTQIKYLTEQIIALRVQVGYIQKGYQVAKEGLDFISKATKGEFDLHDVFFKSLKKINPEVSRYPQVEQISLMLEAAEEKQRQYTRKLKETETLSDDELKYIANVFTRISDDNALIRQELQQVLAPGKLGMSDDERINRINSLYKRAEANYLVTTRFGDEAIKLALSKEAEKAGLQNSRIINQPNK